MLEKSVIEHCSPTLASIKTGNLFTYKYESEEELWKSVDDFNECVKVFPSQSFARVKVRH